MARILIWRRISLTSRKHLQYVYVHVHVRTMYLKYAPYDWLKYWGMAILVCRKKNRAPEDIISWPLTRRPRIGRIIWFTPGQVRPLLVTYPHLCIYYSEGHHLICILSNVIFCRLQDIFHDTQSGRGGGGLATSLYCEVTAPWRCNTWWWAPVWNWLQGYTFLAMRRYTEFLLSWPAHNMNLTR